VFFSLLVLANAVFSMIAFDIPIAFMGYTALSVDRHTTFLTHLTDIEINDADVKIAYKFLFARHVN
jgi:hypothetical protein